MNNSAVAAVELFKIGVQPDDMDIALAVVEQVCSDVLGEFHRLPAAKVADAAVFVGTAAAMAGWRGDQIHLTRQLMRAAKRVLGD